MTKNSQSIVQGALFLIASELSFALGVAIIKLSESLRKLSETEPTLRIVSFFAIFGLGISAIPLIWAWKTPTLSQCFLLIGVGLAATVGQILLTRGYQNAPASSVGIFTYTSVIFGTFLGWLFWKDLLDINYLFGAILIVLAGSIVLRNKATLNFVDP